MKGEGSAVDVKEGKELWWHPSWLEISSGLRNLLGDWAKRARSHHPSRPTSTSPESLQWTVQEVQERRDGRHGEGDLNISLENGIQSLLMLQHFSC